MNGSMAFVVALCSGGFLLERKQGWEPYLKGISLFVGGFISGALVFYH